MSYLKQLAGRLTPPVVASLTGAVLVAIAAFGVTLDLVQQAAIVAFATACAVVVRSYLNPEALIGLVAAAVGVATALGLPVTSAQRESILFLAGAIVTVALGKGAAGIVKAGVAAKREPAASAGIATGVVSINEARAQQGWAAHVTTTEHLHRPRALGRRAPKNAPAIKLSAILRALPASPAIVDHFKGATFGLYGNDRFGVCGPTSVANLVRLVSKGLTGTQVTPSQEDVFTLYRQSGNPKFNPNVEGGVEDNGVELQGMLNALLEHGIGDGKGGIVKPVAFAKVQADSDSQLRAAVSIFGGCLWGVNLLTVQQAQTNATPPKWDYKRTGEWGGHAVLNGKFEPEGSGVDSEVISWEEDVETTDAFRAHQLEEAWVVIFPWHLAHPAFQEGVDVFALAAAYKALTGSELPIPAPTPEPPTPTPTPTPVPADMLDRALWTSVAGWVARRHSSTTAPIAKALAEWAKAQGF